jgi:hypothetical protein
MDRREFLRICGLAGVAVSAPFVPSPARAQDGYDGILYLVVHASGGWDPTSFCDPKGSAGPDTPTPINHYLTDDIRSPSGPSDIRWAPFADNDAFFERHYENLLVFNGIDTSTNSHAVGPRHIHSGVLTEGHPAFAALVAAHQRRASPMAFITNGGYDITRGVVSRTRVGNVNAIERIARPDLLSITNEVPYHTPNTRERIHAAQRARLERLRAAQHLPQLDRSLNEVILSRDPSEASLRALTAYLPDLNLLDTSLGRQGALAMAAYQAGICVSANLSVGGFDTHGNHDTNQANALRSLTQGITEVWNHAEEAGIADRVMMVVGSDFGRTPGYNEGNGKDHWSITSMLMMGAGIRGNRVIGASTDTHRPLALDPQTLETAENGVVLRPLHIQNALRDAAGITGTELGRTYPLDPERLAGLELG